MPVWEIPYYIWNNIYELRCKLYHLYQRVSAADLFFLQGLLCKRDDVRVTVNCFTFNFVRGFFYSLEPVARAENTTIYKLLHGLFVQNTQWKEPSVTGKRFIWEYSNHEAVACLQWNLRWQVNQKEEWQRNNPLKCICSVSDSKRKACSQSADCTKSTIPPTLPQSSNIQKDKLQLLSVK